MCVKRQPFLQATAARLTSGNNSFARNANGMPQQLLFSHARAQQAEQVPYESGMIKKHCAIVESERKELLNLALSAMPLSSSTSSQPGPHETG